MDRAQSTAEPTNKNAHLHEWALLERCLVARGGIEPPTQGFQASSRFRACANNLVGVASFCKLYMFYSAHFSDCGLDTAVAVAAGRPSMPLRAG